MVIEEKTQQLLGKALERGEFDHSAHFFSYINMRIKSRKLPLLKIKHLQIRKS